MNIEPDDVMSKCKSYEAWDLGVSSSRVSYSESDHYSGVDQVAHGKDLHRASSACAEAIPMANRPPRAPPIAIGSIVKQPPVSRIPGRTASKQFCPTRGGFEVTAARDELLFLHGDTTPIEQPPLDKDLEEPLLLDQEITFLSDDSTLDGLLLDQEITFLSEATTQEPLSAKLCTRESKWDSETCLKQEVERAQMPQAAVLQQVEPNRQDVPKRGLSEILKLKLTNAEEENERLQQANEDMSQKLQKLMSMEVVIEI
jgi:hypothetical protein